MLKKTTAGDLDAILEDWSELTLPYGDEGAVYANDLNEKIAQLKKSISEPNNYAYVFENEEGKTKALLSIIHALPKSDTPWLKLLDLDLHPDLVLGDFNVHEAAEAVSFSIFDSIDLLFNDYNSAKELKIYGRTDNMIKTFDRIVKSKALNNIFEKADILCTRSSRWLVFRKK